MDKDKIIKRLEEKNSQIVAENRRLRKLIHSIKISLEQGNDSLPI